MPIVNMSDMLDHAYRNEYAVGSFDVVNLDFLKGILQAAERTRSPVILSLSESNLMDSDFEILMPAIEAAAKRALVPVAIQFNNCSNIDLAIKAINLGCNGIMINASKLSIQENFSLVSDVVKMAHGCGVPVEGKLSFFPVVEDKSPENYLVEHTYNTVEEVKDYVTKSRVDLLDVAIKTRPNSTVRESELDLQRLKQINEALGIPLSIQGIMDFSDMQYEQLIANGVAKIFFNTPLSNINDFSENISSDIADKTEQHMYLLQSSNRADDMLSQCQQWTSVEHLIIYNIEKMNKNEIKSMITEGRQVLSSIPGVREVFTGEAVPEKAAYRYTWLVRFCHPLVIDSYRIHPFHTTFADNLFRPVAGERISIDFQELVNDK